MKLFKLTVAALVLVLLGFQTSVAQTFYGGVNNFDVPVQYLINNKIKINSTTTSTSVKFRVQFFRTLNSAWTSTNGLPKYRFTDITIRFSTGNSSGGNVNLTGEDVITMASFSGSSDEFFVWKEYTVNINKANLTTGHNIYLHYKRSSETFFQAYSKSYGWVLDPPPSGGETGGGNTGAPTFWWDIPNPYSGTAGLHRLHHDYYNWHTLANREEGQYLDNHGWNYEGLLGYIYKSQESETVALHRYFRGQNGDHYFTISASAPSGYDDEGVQGYVYTSAALGRIPIHCYSKISNPAAHVYSKNYNELGGGNGTWNYDGIAFYVLN